MAGRLIAVVGPSGAGKDTLLAAAGRARPDLFIVRRVVTRPQDVGGEPIDSITEAEFIRRRDAGDFALHWQAHGLHYGVPATIDAALAQGRDVLFNGSRAILGDAWDAYPGLGAIHVTAEIPILAERLAARGRESRDEIIRRLARARYEIPYGIPIRVVENNGDLETALAAFLAALQPLSG